MEKNNEARFQVTYRKTGVLGKWYTREFVSMDECDEWWEETRFDRTISVESVKEL
jgi:hypothetical protein